MEVEKVPVSPRPSDVPPMESVPETDFPGLEALLISVRRQIDEDSYRDWESWQKMKGLLREPNWNFLTHAIDELVKKILNLGEENRQAIDQLLWKALDQAESYVDAQVRKNRDSKDICGEEELN